MNTPAFEPLYRRDGPWFIPAPHTASPWSKQSQHGGPVAALITREVEAQPPDGMVLSRLTVEILGPIPRQPLQINIEVLRPGRRVQLLSAQITDQKRKILALAHAWRIRTLSESFDLPHLASTSYPTPAPPDTLPEEPDLFAGIIDYPHFYGQACERRLAEGTTARPGPATIWFRYLCPLVDDEPMTGAQQVAGIADSAQGISWMTTPDRHIFINVDLTINLWRQPEGPWVALAARSRFNPHGMGTSDSLLFDQHGDVGRSNQSILLDHSPFISPPA